MLSSAIPWPSMTVEWFPDVEEVSDNSNLPITNQRLLLGTHTAGQGDELLRIAQATLPDLQAEKKIVPDIGRFEPDLGEIGGYTDKFRTQVNIIQRINHGSDEVNVARHMPQNPNIIATVTSKGTAYIFDRSRHSLSPGKDFKPDISLKHHQGESFGLSWNTFDRGVLLTGSNDSTIALWDINQIPNDPNSAISPKSVYRFHSGYVNDVQWHPFHSSLFGSVSEDSTFRINDTRSPDAAVVYSSGTSEAINVLSFNPANEYLVATGSTSEVITLWDTRKMSKSLHTLAGHTGSIDSLRWSPHHGTILASGSHDRRVNIWDVALIGQQQSAEEEKEGPPELLFVHGGHTANIFDISWNPAVPWMIASVADDNQLHIWRPAGNIVDIE